MRDQKTKPVTKKALLLSVLSMLVTASMLVGSSFAWFTDSVTSSGNRIVSGKLDVELEYRVPQEDSSFTPWENAEGVDNILDADALYEPGYVSLTLLKVKNAGTLAMKYQIAAVKVSETSGINDNNESFKISDYIAFKFVKLTNSTTITKTVADQQQLTTANITREDAKALVGSEPALGFANQNMVEAVLAGEDNKEDIIAFVAYMPETVGNAAKYKVGTTPPELRFDFKVVATQYSSERDSFDEYYDEKAYSPDWNVYQYIKGDIANGLSAYDNTGREVVRVQGTTTNAVTLRVSECNTPVGFGIQSGTTYTSYDISVQDDNGSTPVDTYTVQMYIGTNLPDTVTMYHNGTAMDSASYRYDSTTGYVTFTTTSFSTFTAATAGVVAKVGETWFSSLKEVFDKINSGTLSSGSTVTVTSKKNVLDMTLILGVGKEAILDLNGCVSVTSVNSAIQNRGILTIKDDSKNGSGVVTSDGAFVLQADANNTLTVVENSGTLTLESGKIESKVKFSESGKYLTGISNNGGTLNIQGGEVNVDCSRSLVLDYGNVYGINNASNNTTSIMRMSGGVVNVTAKNGNAYGVQARLKNDTSITGGKINVTCNGKQCYGVYVGDVGSKTDNFLLSDTEITMNHTVPAEVLANGDGIVSRCVVLNDVVDNLLINNCRFDYRSTGAAGYVIYDNSIGSDSYMISNNQINGKCEKNMVGIEFNNSQNPTKTVEKKVDNCSISISSSTRAVNGIENRNIAPTTISVKNCSIIGNAPNYVASGVVGNGNTDLTLTLLSGNSIDLIGKVGQITIYGNVNVNGGSYSVNLPTHKVWSN